MKRVIMFVLAATLMFMGFVYVQAEPEGDSSKLALDMVIVIDDSQSMDYVNSQAKASGNKNGSDPKGYRFDAAVMLLSLCDAENSRASIIAYESQIFPKMEINRYSDKLYELSPSKGNVRKEMVAIEL